jgi:hypothetical protein
MNIATVLDVTLCGLSTKEQSVTFQKTVILNISVVCVLIIWLSPSVLIGF